jgi:hypothetical protein
MMLRLSWLKNELEST